MCSADLMCTSVEVHVRKFVGAETQLHLYVAGWRSASRGCVRLRSLWHSASHRRSLPARRRQRLQLHDAAAMLAGSSLLRAKLLTVSKQSMCKG